MNWWNAWSRGGGRFASTLLQSPDQLPAETVTGVPVYSNLTPDVLAALAENQADGMAIVTIQQTFPRDQLQDKPAGL